MWTRLFIREAESKPSWAPSVCAWKWAMKSFSQMGPGTTGKLLSVLKSVSSGPPKVEGDESCGNPPRDGDPRCQLSSYFRRQMIKRYGNLQASPLLSIQKHAYPISTLQRHPHTL